MNPLPEHFKCTLSSEVRLISVLTFALLIVITTYSFFARPVPTRMICFAIPALIILAGGYYYFTSIELGGEEMLIKGPWHTVRIPLGKQTTVEFVPDAFRGAIRLFGIGGFLGFTGLYRSRLIGRFTAYVTDRRHSVLVKVGTKRIVISPDEVEAFLRAFDRRAERV